MENAQRTSLLAAVRGLGRAHIETVRVSAYKRLLLRGAGNNLSGHDSLPATRPVTRRCRPRLTSTANERPTVVHPPTQDQLRGLDAAMWTHEIWPGS